MSAAGATKNIGVAIMFDGIPAGAITQPVEFSDNSLIQNFNVNNNRIEDGQDYAMIPISDDAHKTLGLNHNYQAPYVRDALLKSSRHTILKQKNGEK